MTLKQKTLINDVGSALLEETVNQLNDSVVPVGLGYSTGVSGAVDYFYVASAISGGIWIKDILMGLDFVVGSTLANIATYVVVESVATGVWGGVGTNTTIINRTNFAGVGAVAVPGDQLISINSLTATTATKTGNFPLWIPAPAQIRLVYSSTEVVARPASFYLLARPVEYELLSTPNYENTLRNFSVK